MKKLFLFSLLAFSTISFAKVTLPQGMYTYNLNPNLYLWFGAYGDVRTNLVVGDTYQMRVVPVSSLRYRSNGTFEFLAEVVWSNSLGGCRFNARYEVRPYELASELLVTYYGPSNVTMVGSQCYVLGNTALTGRFFRN